MDFFAEVFGHMGASISTKSEKYRTTWELGGCEVVCDENPWLEPFFEIEGPSVEAIKSVADILGFDWETRRNDGTRALYFEKYGEKAKMIRNITFEKNPFTI